MLAHRLEHHEQRRAVSSRVEEMEAVHRRLLRLASRVPERRRETAGVCGAWSARETLAHLEAWNVEILDNLRKLREGVGEVSERDVDAFNRRAVRARAGWSWDTVVTRLRASQRDLHSHLGSRVARVGSLTPEEREWIETAVAHDRHHAGQLEAWIHGLGATSSP